MCTLEPNVKDTFSYILTLLCVLWNLRLKIPFYTYLAFLCALQRLIAITVSKTPLSVPLMGGGGGLCPNGWTDVSATDVSATDVSATDVSARPFLRVDVSAKSIFLGDLYNKNIF